MKMMISKPRCHSGIFGLSIAHIVLGVTLLICGIAGLCPERARPEGPYVTSSDNGFSRTTYTSSGMEPWLLRSNLDGLPIISFLFLSFSGAFGIAAMCKRRRCFLTAHLVLSILASVSLGATVIACGVWASISSAVGASVHILFNTIACFLAFAALVCAIISASMSCGNMCSCCCCYHKPAADQDTEELNNAIKYYPINDHYADTMPLQA